MKTYTHIVPLISILQQAGYEAYVCGGAVRDILLGRAPKDIDIATSATPEIVETMFPKTITVGKQFGVVKVVTPDGIIDIATFRKDGQYSDSRRPDTVEFTSAQEDATRRDFTINGLFLDPVSNRIVDYVGGVHDIERKVIRAIGNPRDRFSEDLLRPLRAVRFATQLGFEIETDTFQAIKEFTPSILKVSAERIRDELTKILLSPNRAKGIELLDGSGLLKVILPEVAATKGVAQPPELHPEGDVFVHTCKVLENLPDNPSPALAWAALLHDVGKPATMIVADRIRFNRHNEVGAEIARSIMTRLKTDNNLRDTVTSLVRDHMRIGKFSDMKESKRKTFASQPHFADLLQLHCADVLGRNGNPHLSAFQFIQDWMKKQQIHDTHQPIKLPPRLVTGHDLIQMGLKPGPEFKVILNKVFEAQLEGKVTTRDEALEMVKSCTVGHQIGATQQ